MPVRGKLTPLMPYFIFKVWRESGVLEPLHRVETPPLSEADSYRRAEALVREARRAATPADGYYVHLVFAEDEGEARAKLRAQLGV